MASRLDQRRSRLLLAAWLVAVFAISASRDARVLAGAGLLAALVVPNIGDRVQLRMQPESDIREYRCTGRLFDFSEAGAPLLTIELDMA